MSWVTIVVLIASVVAIEAQVGAQLIQSSCRDFPAQLPFAVVNDLSETFYTGVDKEAVYNVPVFATFGIILGIVFLFLLLFALGSVIWHFCAQNFFRCAQIPVLKALFLIVEAVLILLISPEPRKAIVAIETPQLQQQAKLPSMKSIVVQKQRSIVRKIRSTVLCIERNLCCSTASKIIVMLSYIIIALVATLLYVYFSGQSLENVNQLIPPVARNVVNSQLNLPAKMMPVYLVIPFSMCINATSGTEWACYRVGSSSSAMLNVFRGHFQNDGEFQLTAVIAFQLPSNLSTGRQELTLIFQTGIYVPNMPGTSCMAVSHWKANDYHVLQQLYPNFTSHDEYDVSLKLDFKSPPRTFCTVSEEKIIFHSSSLFYEVSLDFEAKKNYRVQIPVNFQRTSETNSFFSFKNQLYYHLAIDGSTVSAKETLSTTETQSRVTVTFSYAGTRTFFSNSVWTALDTIKVVVFTFFNVYAIRSTLWFLLGQMHQKIRSVNEMSAEKQLLFSANCREHLDKQLQDFAQEVNSEQERARVAVSSYESERAYQLIIKCNDEIEVVCYVVQTTSSLCLCYIDNATIPINFTQDFQHSQHELSITDALKKMIKTLLTE